MFTLTKINLLWDKVKVLTGRVDTMAKIPRGSVVIGLMSGTVTIPETPRNEIGDAFKKNIPCFIVFSSSNVFKNMYRVTQCYYDITTGALTEIVAIQMKKDAVGHYYIDAKANNGWSAEAIAVDGSTYTPPNYSTNEVDTGVKWIDNNNVYRKVFHYTENISGTHNHDITNFGDLVKCNLVCKRADGYIEQAPIVPRQSGWNMSIEDVTTTSFTLFIGTQYTSTYAITDAWVILEYTKAPATLTKKKTKKVKEEE